MECTLLEQRLAGEPLPPVPDQRLRASGRIGDHWVDLFVTGVGAVNTTWTLARALGRFPYKLLVNVGVCGALDPALEVGSAVYIWRDSFGDLGAEDADGRLLDLRALNLSLLTRQGEASYNTLEPPPLPWPAPPLPRAQGLTCNTAHGEAARIAALRAQWPQAQVESMEGAACFYAGVQSGLATVGIRGVSNRVEPRNRAAWQLTEAAEAAQRALMQWIEQLPA